MESQPSAFLTQVKHVLDSNLNCTPIISSMYLLFLSTSILPNFHLYYLDFIPSCITSPETSFRSASLNEDRQERKTQVAVQSRDTTPPKANFNIFFNTKNIRPDISKA